MFSKEEKKGVNFDPIGLSGAITPVRVSILCNNFFDDGWDITLSENIGLQSVHGWGMISI